MRLLGFVPVNIIGVPPYHGLKESNYEKGRLKEEKGSIFSFSSTPAFPVVVRPLHRSENKKGREIACSCRSDCLRGQILWI
jgi:hypothetical protein